MKKLLFLLLAAAIAASGLLASCASNSGDAKTTDEAGANDAQQGLEGEDEATEPQFLLELPEGANYGGYEFKVLTRGDEMHQYPLHSRDIIAEEEIGEPINDAVFKRNIIVEDLLNIQMTMIALDEGDETRPNQAVKKAVAAGDDMYDLLMTHEIYSAPTAQSGYLMNMANIPYIDFSKPWWCKSATDDLSFGNKIFLALSDFSVSSNDHAYIVLFNKNLHQEFALDNLYEAVLSNKWTFDVMYDLIKDVSKDLNGDGKMTIDDLYGLILGGGQLNFFYAGGNTVMKKDENNIPYYDILTERAISTFEKAYDICVGDHTFSFSDWNDVKVPPTFAEGHGLLMTTQIGIVPQLRDMDVDFGIIPYPKLDEQQEKYAEYVDGHAQLMSVPITVQDTEKVGAIIEALSYYSREYVVPAYYDINLKTKFSRDAESSEMLDIIMEGRVFDFGYVYDNWVVAFKFADQINAKKREFVSIIEKNLPAAEKQLVKIIDAYESID
ncbi:MAG: hypothetical protein FWG34_00055 [Oscillospiraceae bacterium]|nr:hypothetical protein [Oscillospiraceae bacterium]